MIEQTKNKLKKLIKNLNIRFYDRYQQPENINNQLSIDEFISAMVDTEFEDRYTRKVDRLTRLAKFRQLAYMKDIDTSRARGFDRELFLRLSNFNWIKKANNVLITGATGSGKSFIACALGQGACKNEYKVMYTTASKLIRKIKEAKLDLTVSRFLNKISKQQLLIIDDFGLEPIDSESCHYFLEIIEDRYRINSTIISTQYPIELLKKIFEDPTIADAIIDRIIHNSYKIELALGEKSRRADVTVD